MKNNIVVILLVVLIGILAGLGLLFGIGNAVQVAVSPMVQRLAEISVAQRGIEQHLRSAGSSDQMAARLAAIEQKINQLDQKLTAPPPAPAANEPPVEDFNKAYTIGIGSTPVVGKKDAPVSIQEFMDMQCPYCSRFYPPVKETLKAYPDQVNLIIKNYPLGFHPNARPAAKMALAANEQGKYIEMVEALLDNGGDVSEAKVKEYAQKIGLDYKKLTDDAKNKDAQYEKQINDDLALGGQVDVRGTPTFFINGHKTMARDFNGFKAEIDKLLAEKK